MNRVPDVPLTTTLPATADVVIVGGGIWGLSTAWHLSRLRPQWSVCVIERGQQLAGETTLQAAGQIGQLRSHPVMTRGVAYTLQTLSRFRELVGHDPGLETPGSVHLALCPERLAAFERHGASNSLPPGTIRLVSPEEIEQFTPIVDPQQICGALHVAGDGYVGARQTALAYAAAATDGGVQIAAGVECVGLVADSSGRLERVITTGGEIQSRRVVLTAGPWTARLAESLGVRLPVQGIRLQQARTAPLPEARREHPVVRIPDASCYLRPEAGGFLFGFFDPEPLPLDPRGLPAGWRTAELARAVELVDESRRRLRGAIPCLGDVAIDEYRQGIVTCAPDGWYVLGPIESHPGLWVATGCAAMGIAGSAAVGNWLSRWIADGSPGESLELMSPARLPELVARPADLQAACCRTYANYYSLGGGVTYSVG
ncbi:MAG: FAD-binding oxidoreductase [Pirellulales bacterium]